MTVAKTLAWSLTPKSRQDEIEKSLANLATKVYISIAQKARCQKTVPLLVAQ